MFRSFHVFLAAVPVGQPVSPYQTGPSPRVGVLTPPRRGRRRGGRRRSCPGTGGGEEAQTLWQEEELFSPQPAGRVSAGRLLSCPG